MELLNYKIDYTEKQLPLSQPLDREKDPQLTIDNK